MVGGKWFKMDDEYASEVTEEKILKLSGGGDHHCAYLLLYGPRRLKVAKESAEDKKMDTTEATTASKP